MLSTGLDELDKLLKGGYPDKSAILVVGPPGIGKEALGYWFIENGLTREDFCLYVTRLAVSEVLQDIRAFGINGQSAPVWFAREGGQTRCDLNDLPGLSFSVKETLRRNGEKRIRVVTDVLSSLLMLNSPEVIYRYVSQLLSDVKQYDAVFLATIEDGMHQPQVLAAMQQLFDGVSTVFVILWVLVVGLFSCAAYWAFIIRKALVTGLYRKQALWAGTMGLYLVSLSTFLTIALSFNLTTLSVNILGGLLISSGFIVLFAWIDSTVRVARRSDPLLRDTLRWSRLRYFIGFVTVFGAISALLTSINSGFALVAPFGGALFFGAIALLISARRSGDTTLRRHLKWMGLAIAMLWLASQLTGILCRIFPAGSITSEVITYSVVVVGGFCLYRSARSLVPLGHMPLPDASLA